MKADKQNAEGNFNKITACRKEIEDFSAFLFNFKVMMFCKFSL